MPTAHCLDAERRCSRGPFLRLAGLMAAAAVLVANAAGPASAHELATWTGKVAYVNLNKVAGYQKVGVNAKQETKTFLIGDEFTGVKTSLDSAPRTLQDLKPGMQVKVQYYKDTVFGADKAIEIDIFNGFNLNVNQQ